MSNIKFEKFSFLVLQISISRFFCSGQVCTEKDKEYAKAEVQYAILTLYIHLTPLVLLIRSLAGLLCLNTVSSHFFFFN